jgi:diguanylate cyclase (GGDEF)-like protein
MDPLTGVQNTRSFRETLRHEFSVARRYDSPLSLLMMDVDHFKALNDTHGHPSGDGVLKQLAGLVKRCVRASDVVARTGGDEFAVILVKANRQQAVQLASRIHQEVSKSPFVVHGREICVEVSIGLATYPDHGEIEDPDMLVYFSDQALLEAKETGRNRLVTMDEIPEAVRSRLHRQYHHTKYTTAKLYADAEEETT